MTSESTVVKAQQGCDIEVSIEHGPGGEPMVWLWAGGHFDSFATGAMLSVKQASELRAVLARYIAEVEEIEIVG